MGSAATVRGLERRIARWQWPDLEEQLEVRGHALPGRLLAARECNAFRRMFDDDERFRSTIDMAPKRYGDGRYRYFAYPLPEAVQRIRTLLYPPLARIANRWWERLGKSERFEPQLGGFLERCHAADQERPTPLLLNYGAGGYNRLHQDVYGAVAFPFQVVVQLTEPGEDFTGGEFLLTEQRARMQSRGWSVGLTRGDALIFPNAIRPVSSPRGDSRANVRHGVSDVLSGSRTTLGIIFHDAA